MTVLSVTTVVVGGVVVAAVAMVVVVTAVATVGSAVEVGATVTKEVFFHASCFKDLK